MGSYSAWRDSKTLKESEVDLGPMLGLGAKAEGRSQLV